MLPFWVPRSLGEMKRVIVLVLSGLALGSASRSLQTMPQTGIVTPTGAAPAAPGGSSSLPGSITPSPGTPKFVEMTPENAKGVSAASPKSVAPLQPMAAQGQQQQAVGAQLKPAPQFIDMTPATPGQQQGSPILTSSRPLPGMQSVGNVVNVPPPPTSAQPPVTPPGTVTVGTQTTPVPVVQGQGVQGMAKPMQPQGMVQPVPITQQPQQQPQGMVQPVPITQQPQIMQPQQQMQGMQQQKPAPQFVDMTLATKSAAPGTTAAAPSSNSPVTPTSTTPQVQAGASAGSMPKSMPPPHLVQMTPAQPNGSAPKFLDMTTAKLPSATTAAATPALKPQPASSLPASTQPVQPALMDMTPKVPLASTPSSTNTATAPTAATPPAMMVLDKPPTVAAKPVVPALQEMTPVKAGRKLMSSSAPLSGKRLRGGRKNRERLMEGRGGREEQLEQDEGGAGQSEPATPTAEIVEPVATAIESPSAPTAPAVPAAPSAAAAAPAAPAAPSAAASAPAPAPAPATAPATETEASTRDGDYKATEESKEQDERNTTVEKETRAVADDESNPWSMVSSLQVDFVSLGLGGGVILAIVSAYCCLLKRRGPSSGGVDVYSRLPQTDGSGGGVELPALEDQEYGVEEEPWEDDWSEGEFTGPGASDRKGPGGSTESQDEEKGVAVSFVGQRLSVAALEAQRKPVEAKKKATVAASAPDVDLFASIGIEARPKFKAPSSSNASLSSTDN